MWTGSPKPTITKFLCLVFAIHLFNLPLIGQDGIVLRDLTILKNRKVTDFDGDQVELDNGRVLTWDQIYSVNSDNQKFNEFQARLSLPLHRLKSRVLANDFAGALEPAEQLKKIFATNRESKTYGLILATELAGRLERSQRELAARTLLEFQSFASNQDYQKFAASILKRLKLDYDFETGQCAQLPPIFFDQTKATSVLASFASELDKENKNQLELFYVYTAALASAAKESKISQQAVSKLKINYPNSQWLKLFESLDNHQELLRVISKTNNQSIWVTGQYHLGLQQLQNSKIETQQLGAINLLKIPAVTDTIFPEVSAASLAHVAQWYAGRKEKELFTVLRKEIIYRYADTFFGQKNSTHK